MAGSKYYEQAGGNSEQGLAAKLGYYDRELRKIWMRLGQRGSKDGELHQHVFSASGVWEPTDTFQTDGSPFWTPPANALVLGMWLTIEEVFATVFTLEVRWSVQITGTYVNVVDKFIEESGVGYNEDLRISSFGIQKGEVLQAKVVGPEAPQPVFSNLAVHVNYILEESDIIPIAVPL